MVFKLPRLFDGNGGPGGGSKKRIGRKNNSAASSSSSTTSGNTTSYTLGQNVWGGDTNISNPISGGTTYTVNTDQTPSPERETATWETKTGGGGGGKPHKLAESNSAYLESFKNKTDQALYEKHKGSSGGPGGVPGTPEYAEWKVKYNKGTVTPHKAEVEFSKDFNMEGLEEPGIQVKVDPSKSVFNDGSLELDPAEDGADGTSTNNTTPGKRGGMGKAFGKPSTSKKSPSRFTSPKNKPIATTSGRNENHPLKLVNMMTSKA